MAEGKNTTSPQSGEEEVEARDTGSEGDQTTNADDNAVHPQNCHLFGMLCTVEHVKHCRLMYCNVMYLKNVKTCHTCITVWCILLRAHLGNNEEGSGEKEFEACRCPRFDGGGVGGREKTSVPSTG